MDQSLSSLIAASVAFVGMHFVLSHPLRSTVMRLAGDIGFQAIYSLVALASFVWMVMAFRAVGPGGSPLWNGQGEAIWALASLITLVAAVLLAGSFLGNPALSGPRAAALAAKEPAGVFRVTRHPMMWSFALWALAHVLVSPTPRQLVLAGAVAFLALAGSHMQDRKKAVLMGDAWSGWAAKTAFWPRLGGLAGAGLVPWLGGIALWLAASWAHLWGNGMAAGIFRYL
jgi:uncharacterized membrane protein